MKSSCIAWTRYDRRSELLAHHLGGSLHFITTGQRGKALQLPLRYLRQARQTQRVLEDERPDIVVMQNPPVFGALAALAYTRRSGARLVLDSHSGAFLSPKWRWSLPLQRYCSHQASATVVPNRYLEGIVQSWGCRAIALGFTPGQYPAGEPYPIDGPCGAAVISTFTEDEPLDVVLEAAARLPQVSFYITGDSTRLARRLVASKPANCHLTGFLSYERYIGLLRSVDVVIDLTRQDHTLLMGAYEAVSLGVPLIVSDWAILRDYFSQGTVHVSNTVDGLSAGIQRAQRDLPRLREEIHLLRERLQAEWNEQFGILRRWLDTPSDPATAEKSPKRYLSKALRSGSRSTPE